MGHDGNYAAGDLGRLKSHMRDWSEDDRYDVRSKQGWPGPFIELRVMRPDGSEESGCQRTVEAPRDGQTPGELEVRGPWVAGNYYNAPDQSHRWTADGWFKTGDVATMDDEGYIKLVDRAKDLVKSGGEWISSVDLENTLMGHPAVREAAVVGIPHPKWQERPLAVVVLKEGASATPEELRRLSCADFCQVAIAGCVCVHGGDSADFALGNSRRRHCGSSLRIGSGSSCAQ